MYSIYKFMRLPKDQGRSQGLNRSLQDIAQNFDDDVIIMTLTPSLLHRRKT